MKAEKRQAHISQADNGFRLSVRTCLKIAKEHGQHPKPLQLDVEEILLFPKLLVCRALQLVGEKLRSMAKLVTTQERSENLEVAEKTLARKISISSE